MNYCFIRGVSCCSSAGGTSADSTSSQNQGRNSFLYIYFLMFFMSFLT